MAIWRMRIACWIPKAANTHSEYVTHITFSLEQLLSERDSLLLSTCIACRVTKTCFWTGEWCCWNVIEYLTVRVNAVACAWSTAWLSKPLAGRDNSVGITTRYGQDDPGAESRWGEISRTRPDRTRGPPSLLYKGYRVFPGGKAAGAWHWAPTHI